MPQRTRDGHKWVAATTIDLPTTQVKSAHKRGTYTIPAEDDVKVSIEEVYCRACRLGYEKAAGKPCSALASREHLIGGPLGDQRKRQPEPERLAATG